MNETIDEAKLDEAMERLLDYTHPKREQEVAYILFAIRVLRAEFQAFKKSRELSDALVDDLASDDNPRIVHASGGSPERIAFALLVEFHDRARRAKAARDGGKA